MTSLARLADSGDWSPAVFEEAINAFVARFTIVRQYHVPYLAGYSIDGKTIYIDSRLPTGFVWEGEWLATDRFLIVHEGIEKDLEVAGLVYQLRHQIALHFERDAVVTICGLPAAWMAYQSFMQTWINFVEKEGYIDLPPQLDMTPYRDEDDKGMAKALRVKRHIHVHV